MFLVILLSVLAFLFWKNYVRPLRHWYDRGVKQSKPWVFFGDFWGNVLRLKSFAEFIEWIYGIYPDARYYGVYQFTHPTLLLRDPELIRQIAVKDFDYFIDRRPFTSPNADPLWDGNLFALTGQRWREMRATLSACFTSSKMKYMYNLIAESAENFAEHFRNKQEDLIEVEMKDIITRYTNDVIATTAFGIKVDTSADPKNEFYRMGLKITDFNSPSIKIKFFLNFVAPKIIDWLKISIFDKAGLNFFSSIIYQAIKDREKTGVIRPDMLNLLLETRKGAKQSLEENEPISTEFAVAQESPETVKYKKHIKLSDEDITSQALVFFFAGFETVSSVLSFGCYELAINSDVQRKLRKEIKETNQKNKEVTYEVLLKMKYMDMVLSEMLRKWNPLVALDRVCQRPYTIEPVLADEKHLRLVKGDNVWIPIHAIHRDPAYYPNPTKFDPKRFSEENKHNIKPYTYMPFGVGPRNCIGSRMAILEMKSLLFNLLLDFELVPTERTQIPLKISKDSLSHTAESGIWVALKRVKGTG